MSMSILFISEPLCATKFIFQKSPDLPAIAIKVKTKNKKIETRKIHENENQPVEIDVIGGDEIAELYIQGPCKAKGALCEELDEIYITAAKPSELKSSETNKSERKTYVEKIKRYYQPDLVGKTTFSIKAGWGIDGFFEVKALDLK